ncbi:MAG: hypothetical protein E6K18_05115 [Methanobacteriota archaeon]|nr:MAG: hypothetical protein E6K18_05115 [Euryarchaeota archaeon]
MARTTVGSGAWKRLGLAFLVMAVGLGTGFVGLVWDFYNHVIVGLSPATESLLAPAHVMIFTAIPLTGLGFVLGALALRRGGHTPLRMLLT